MSDQPGEMNELLVRAVESITKGMAEAFDVVWSRPDAALLVEQFLAGALVFRVDRHGVTILVAAGEEG